MKINGAMITLAREYRGLTQEELARKLFVAQAKVAKLEGGLQTDVPDPLMKLLSDALNFPHSFFEQEEDLLGYGSSAYYYRKRADLSATDRKRIHGLINLLRIHLKRLLTFVDVQGRRTLPQLDIDDYGGSAAKVAQAVRAFWNLPEGPIKNLTVTLESAGIIVIPCDFQTRSMDATSLRLSEMPPVIFVNKSVPGDRWRFTLSHELAHLIMHNVPHEFMEDEADDFAAEFLVPKADIKPQFARLPNLRLQDFANLKSYWKVSMGMLIKRAHSLKFLTDNQSRYLWMTMSKLGYRTKEPNPIERETPRNYANILSHMTQALKYSADDLAQLLKINPQDLKSLHDVSASPRLRVV